MKWCYLACFTSIKSSYLYNTVVPLFGCHVCNNIGSLDQVTCCSNNIISSACDIISNVMDLSMDLWRVLLYFVDMTLILLY